MDKKINKQTETLKKRPPMMIDNGEVVFVPRNDKCENAAMHKPTPLLLCNEVSKMFAAIMRENTVKECPMQGSYRDILFHLAREDGRTQLELANLVHITPPSVSVALQKLEDEGYIKRIADESDKRKTRVYLTEKGKGIDEKARNVIRHLEKEASRDFTDEELNTLCVLLFRLRENIANDKQ